MLPGSVFCACVTDFLFPRPQIQTSLLSLLHLRPPRLLSAHSRQKSLIHRKKHFLWQGSNIPVPHSLLPEMTPRSNFSCTLWRIWLFCALSAFLWNLRKLLLSKEKDNTDGTEMFSAPHLRNILKGCGGYEKNSLCKIIQKTKIRQGISRESRTGSVLPYFCMY